MRRCFNWFRRRRLPPCVLVCPAESGRLCIARPLRLCAAGAGRKKVRTQSLHAAVIISNHDSLALFLPRTPAWFASFWLPKTCHCLHDSLPRSPAWFASSSLPEPCTQYAYGFCHSVCAPNHNSQAAHSVRERCGRAGRHCDLARLARVAARQSNKHGPSTAADTAVAADAAIAKDTCHHE